MEFTLGDIIVLAVAAIMLFVYRQLDKSNQSLSKVKRFTDLDLSKKKKKSE